MIFSPLLSDRRSVVKVISKDSVSIVEAQCNHVRSIVEAWRRDSESLVEA